MLNEAIKTILGNDAAVMALVEDRIYPLLTPETGTLPAISYFHVDEPHEHVLEGRGGIARPRIQVDVWSYDRNGISGFDEAWAIAQAVFNVLDSFRGTVGDVTIVDSECLDRRDFYEPLTKIFHVSSDFQILHRE